MGVINNWFEVGNPLRLEEYIYDLILYSYVGGYILCNFQYFLELIQVINQWYLFVLHQIWLLGLIMFVWNFLDIM